MILAQPIFLHWLRRLRLRVIPALSIMAGLAALNLIVGIWRGAGLIELLGWTILFAASMTALVNIYDARSSSRRHKTALRTAARDKGLRSQRASSSLRDHFTSDPHLSSRFGVQQPVFVGDLELDGRRIEVFEHHSHVQADREETETIHKGIMTHVPAWWPSMRIDSKRVCESLQTRDIPSGSDELTTKPSDGDRFASRYSITVEDRQFADALLSPDMKAWFAQRSHKSVWLVEEGYLVFIEPGSLKAMDIAALTDAVRQFLLMVRADLLVDGPKESGEQPDGVPLIAPVRETQQMA